MTTGNYNSFNAQHEQHKVKPYENIIESIRHTPYSTPPSRILTHTPNIKRDESIVKNEQQSNPSTRESTFSSAIDPIPIAAPFLRTFSHTLLARRSIIRNFTTWWVRERESELPRYPWHVTMLTMHTLSTYISIRTYNATVWVECRNTIQFHSRRIFTPQFNYCFNEHKMRIKKGLTFLIFGRRHGTRLFNISISLSLVYIFLKTSSSKWRWNIKRCQTDSTLNFRCIDALISKLNEFILEMAQLREIKLLEWTRQSVSQMMEAKFNWNIPEQLKIAARQSPPARACAVWIFQFIYPDCVAVFTILFFSKRAQQIIIFELACCHWWPYLCSCLYMDHFDGINGISHENNMHANRPTNKV